MTNTLKRLSFALPAALLLLTGSVAWALLRFTPQLPWTSLTPATRAALTAGYLLVLLLLATVILILSSAGFPVLPRRHRWLNFALVSDSLALLLLLPIFTAQLTLADAAKIFVIATPWLALWTAFARAIGGYDRGGQGVDAGGGTGGVGSISPPLAPTRPGVSATLSLTVAILLFSAPVTLFPLTSNPAALSICCPPLAILDASRASTPYVWYQGRGNVMYHLSPLGQDLPAPLPTWWHSVLLFATLALLATAASELTIRSPRKPE